MGHSEKIDKNIPKIVERSEAYQDIIQILGCPLNDFTNLTTLKKIMSYIDTATDIELELAGKSYGIERFELESDAKLRAKLQQTLLLYREMGSKRYMIDRLNEISGVQNAYIRDTGDWGAWLLGYSILGYDTVLNSGATQPFAINVYAWHDETMVDGSTLTSKIDNYMKKIAPAGAEWSIICKSTDNWIHCPTVMSAGVNAAFNANGEGILKDIDDPVFSEANTPVDSVTTEVDMVAGIRVRVREIYSNLYYEISYDQGVIWTDAKLVFEQDKIYYTKNPNLKVITNGDGIKSIKITFNRFNFDTLEWDKWEGYLKIYVFISDTTWLEQWFIGLSIYFDANTLKAISDRDKIQYIARTATRESGAGSAGFGIFDFGEDDFGEGIGMNPDDPMPDGWTNWQPIWRESSLLKSDSAVYGLQFGIVIDDMTIDKQKFWHRWFTIKKY